MDYLSGLLMKEDKEALIKRGLNEAEANTLYNLLKKIKLTEGDKAGFNHELEQGIPFEGGMGFSEALTALIYAINQ